VEDGQESAVCAQPATIMNKIVEEIMMTSLVCNLMEDLI